MFVLLGHNPVLSWHVLLLSLFPFGRWGLLHIHPRVLETCPVLGFGFGFFWSTFLTSWDYKTLQPHLVFPLSHPGISHFPKEPGSLLLESGVRNRGGVLRCHAAHSRLSRKCVCVSVCVCVCVCSNPAHANVCFSLSLSAYVFKNI